jgi:hypothetical protein
MRVSSDKTDIPSADSALVGLMLRKRAAGDMPGMLRAIEGMPSELRSTTMVQEQLGFALNRLGRRDEAERVLVQVLELQGPSSETLGILGRVYKDRWEEAQATGRPEAVKYLDLAIDAYRRGFEADWRDHYPGINAVTLMELKDTVDPEQAKILPVVRYSVERRIAAGKADYWDWATLLELTVLLRDQAGAGSALTGAIGLMRDPWEGETTARNLRLIRETRFRRGEEAGWIEGLERVLRSRAR